jgi:hypothetical protein
MVAEEAIENFAGPFSLNLAGEVFLIESRLKSLTLGKK